MGLDRDHMRARAPWRGLVVSACRRWLIGGWHWRATVVLLCAGLASMLASVATSGLMQLSAQVVFTALWLAVGGKHVVHVVRDVHTQSWTWSGRFTCLQYPALVGGVLITLVPGYGLLVFIYPSLHSSPLTRVAVVLAMALRALSLTMLALALLALVGVLLAVPIRLMRALAQERQHC